MTLGVKSSPIWATNSKLIAPIGVELQKHTRLIESGSSNAFTSRSSAQDSIVLSSHNHKVWRHDAAPTAMSDVMHERLAVSLNEAVCKRFYQEA